MRRRLVVQAAGILVALAATGLGVRPPAVEPLAAMRGLAAGAQRLRSVGDEEIDGSASDPNTLDRGLVMPTGEPTAITCDEARTVVQQARTSIAAPVAPVDAAKFAAATSDWLDPHGLWSVAPDAPIGAVLKRNGERLVAELEAPPGSGPCSTAQAVGVEMAAWSEQVRRHFDRGEQDGLVRGRSLDLREAWKLASSTPFEDGSVTKHARALAEELGRHVGTLRSAYGEVLAPYAQAARRRAAPKLDAEAWSRVIMAAALRAYIPQLDAHGAWAPMDEELSIYDLALEAAPPVRLWTDRLRTALGVRIEHGVLPPLVDGDVVLDVGGVALAGMSIEQVEQLAVLSDTRSDAVLRVKVLRAQQASPLDVRVAPSRNEGEGPMPPAQELAVTTTRYGEGHAAIIQIPDVPDDLGSRLSVALERAQLARDLRGVVLDLRANGGGSTDGAIAALGIFLPGVSLFPMRRRDGAMEVERAPEVPGDKRYAGPLAVLVDGDSASAAEMIAGALWSYHRATVIGDRTYGKGCAQEYLDDDAHTGVLRLTTLLFSLPDGSPVQKTGIVPNVRLSLNPVTEREAMLPHALGPWRGPDVRDPGRVQEVPWPTHGGRVGPCRDATVCRALRSLGAAPAAAR